MLYPCATVFKSLCEEALKDAPTGHAPSDKAQSCLGTTARTSTINGPGSTLV